MRVQYTWWHNYFFGEKRKMFVFEIVVMKVMFLDEESCCDRVSRLRRVWGPSVLPENSNLMVCASVVSVNEWVVHVCMCACLATRTITSAIERVRWAQRARCAPLYQLCSAASDGGSAHRNGAWLLHDLYGKLKTLPKWRTRKWHLWDAAELSWRVGIPRERKQSWRATCGRNSAVRVVVLYAISRWFKSSRPYHHPLKY